MDICIDKTRWGIGVKRAAALICIALCFFFYRNLFGSLFGDKHDATGRNINIYSNTDSAVYFKPVCPECDHIGSMYSVNLSAGEDHSTVHVCERCFEVFALYIKNELCVDPFVFRCITENSSLFNALAKNQRC